MGVLTLFGRRTQACATLPSGASDLPDTGSWLAAAAELSAPPEQAELPATPPASPNSSPQPRSRRSRARTKAKRIQLNVDVSADFKRRLRTFANQRGISMGAAVEALCAAQMERERQ